MATYALDSYRDTIHDVAEAIAPTWERRRVEIEEVATPVREWMLRELRPRTGDTVLELAAGVGETGFEAAALIGDEGRLITTDLSPAMLEAAQRRGAELGVANVEYRVMDAERIELDEDSVDGVLCRFGIPDADEYLSVIADTAGPIALAVRGLAEPARAAVKADVEDSLRRFAAEGGYELPAVALCAVAS